MHQLWRSMGFKKLKLDQKLLEAIEHLGLTIPTAVQEETIPLILEGKDVRASAQTGTGKTAAFVLPSLQHLIAKKATSNKGPRVLILTPTRELAIQISKEVSKFSNNVPFLKTISIYGGTPYAVQARQLRKPYDILVATPGRLIDQMERNQIFLNNIEILILDEADRMLDMGFFDPVMEIAKKIPAKRQTLLFSATLKGAVLKLSEKLLSKEFEEIQIKATEKEQALIEEHFYSAKDFHDKHRLLLEILQKPDLQQAIVFTATKRSSETLAKTLAREGLDAKALHGDMRQRQREKTIQLVRQGKIKVLVATDVAARGIDILTISHIINFDLPMNAEDYIHRIGRTGRAGASGIAISLATAKDRSVLREIERCTGQTIPLFKDFAKKEFSQKKTDYKSSKNNFAKKSRHFHPREERFKKSWKSSKNRPFFKKSHKKENF